MPIQPVPQGIRDELLKVIKSLQRKAMTPGIPIAQMIALKNRAQELFDQLIELDAAEFNSDTQHYKDGVENLTNSIGKLQKTIDDIDDAIAILNTAAEVFGTLDRLLKIAAKFNKIF